MNKINTSIISIRGLSFAYESINVLENINFDIQKGDFLAIIGPNGGGKSTLLKLILSLLKIQKGQIEFCEQLKKNKFSHIGYVPQNTNINCNFPIKVIEVVMMGYSDDGENFFKKYFSIGYSKREKLSAMDALKKVGMEQYANKRIGKLSGGQRQRVMIARALCAKPKILFLDEPTANIDVDGQKKIYDLLKELNKIITIVVVSHDITIIMNYANKVVHVNKILTFHNLNEEIEKEQQQNEHFCEVEMFQLFVKEYQKKGKIC